MNTASRVTIGERREAMAKWLRRAGPTPSIAAHAADWGHRRPGLSSRKVSADADAHIEQERMRAQTVKDDGECRDLGGI
jgi:hypothetical protein